MLKLFSKQLLHVCDSNEYGLNIGLVRKFVRFLLTCHVLRLDIPRTNCFNVYYNQFWTDYIYISIEEKRLELITRKYVSIIFLDKVTRLEYSFSSTICRIVMLHNIIRNLVISLCLR